LDIGPKIRSELSKILKLEKKRIASATSNLNSSMTLVNIWHNYESHSKELKENELAMAEAAYRHLQ